MLYVLYSFIYSFSGCSCNDICWFWVSDDICAPLCLQQCGIQHDAGCLCNTVVHSHTGPVQFYWSKPGRGLQIQYISQFGKVNLHKFKIHVNWLIYTAVCIIACSINILFACLFPYTILYTILFLIKIIVYVFILFITTVIFIYTA